MVKVSGFPLASALMGVLVTSAATRLWEVSTCRPRGGIWRASARRSAGTLLVFLFPSQSALARAYLHSTLRCLGGLAALVREALITLDRLGIARLIARARFPRFGMVVYLSTPATTRAC